MAVIFSKPRLSRVSSKAGRRGRVLKEVWGTMGDIKKNCKIKDLATVYRLQADSWEIESRECDWIPASRQITGITFREAPGIKK